MSQAYWEDGGGLLCNSRDLPRSIVMNSNFIGKQGEQHLSDK